MANDFYVYAWLRPCGTPFYIGKGRGDRDKLRTRNNKIFTRTLAKIEKDGGRATVVRIHENLSEFQALSLEIAEIAKWGRRCDGTGVLANLTLGGEGMSGFVFSDEAKKKMSAAKKGKPLSAEHRAKILEIVTNPSPETRAKMSASRTGKKATATMMARLIENNPTRDPEIRAKISAALSGVPKSDAHRAKLSVAAKNRTVGHRARISQANRMRPPSSGYKGVSFNTATGKWKVGIRIGDKRLFLGYFADPVEAAMVYDRAAVDAWGVGNCYLNFPTAVLDVSPSQENGALDGVV